MPSAHQRWRTPTDPGGSLLGPGASVASAVTMYLLLMMVLAWGLALLLRRAWASAAALCTLCAVVRCCR